MYWSWYLHACGAAAAASLCLHIPPPPTHTHRLLPPVLDAAAQAAKAYCAAAAPAASRSKVNGSVMAGLLQLWGPLARLLKGAALLARPEALENLPIANVHYM